MPSLAEKFERLNNSIQLAASKGNEHLEESIINALMKNKIIETPQKILDPVSISEAIQDFENDMQLSYEEYLERKIQRQRFNKAVFWLKLLSFVFGLILSYWLSHEAISEAFKLEILNLRNKESNLGSLANFELAVNLLAILPITISILAEMIYRAFTKNDAYSNYRSAKAGLLFSLNFVILSIAWILIQITYRTAIDTETFPILTKFLFFISILFPSILVTSLPFVLRSLKRYYSITFTDLKK